jgi:dipeptidyl aminopeptidase/acylaminoacyl peptidase
LLIHGDADEVVPLQQSQRLMNELKQRDVPVELIVKKGGGHPWLTIPVEVAKMADWFDRQLGSNSE